MDLGTLHGSGPHGRIVEADVLSVGATEATRVHATPLARRMAQEHGVLMVPHGWNTGIGVAADLAISAAMPVARWVEYQTGVPYIEDIIDPPFRLDDEGMLRVPTGPGLGVRLNREALGRYTR